ncbi:hypothetical protein JCM10296v2_003359 [Rhodotorula toruloides]
MAPHLRSEALAGSAQKELKSKGDGFLKLKNSREVAAMRRAALAGALIDLCESDNEKSEAGKRVAGAGADSGDEADLEVVESSYKPAKRFVKRPKTKQLLAISPTTIQLIPPPTVVTDDGAASPMSTSDEADFEQDTVAQRTRDKGKSKKIDVNDPLAVIPSDYDMLDSSSGEITCDDPNALQRSQPGRGVGLDVGDHAVAIEHEFEFGIAPPKTFATSSSAPPASASANIDAAYRPSTSASTPSLALLPTEVKKTLGTAVLDLLEYDGEDVQSASIVVFLQALATCKSSAIAIGVSPIKTWKDEPSAAARRRIEREIEEAVESAYGECGWSDLIKLLRDRRRQIPSLLSTLTADQADVRLYEPGFYHLITYWTAVLSCIVASEVYDVWRSRDVALFFLQPFADVVRLLALPYRLSPASRQALLACFASTSSFDAGEFFEHAGKKHDYAINYLKVMNSSQEYGGNITAPRSSQEGRYVGETIRWYPTRSHGYTSEKTDAARIDPRRPRRRITSFAYGTPSQPRIKNYGVNVSNVKTYVIMRVPEVSWDHFVLHASLETTNALGFGALGNETQLTPMPLASPSFHNVALNVAIPVTPKRGQDKGAVEASSIRTAKLIQLLGAGRSFRVNYAHASVRLFPPGTVNEKKIDLTFPGITSRANKVKRIRVRLDAALNIFCTVDDIGGDTSELLSTMAWCEIDTLKWCGVFFGVDAELDDEMLPKDELEALIDEEGRAKISAARKEPDNYVDWLRKQKALSASKKDTTTAGGPTLLACSISQHDDGSSSQRYRLRILRPDVGDFSILTVQMSAPAYTKAHSAAGLRNLSKFTFPTTATVQEVEPFTVHVGTAPLGPLRALLSKASVQPALDRITAIASVRGGRKMTERELEDREAETKTVRQRQADFFERRRSGASTKEGGGMKGIGTEKNEDGNERRAESTPKLSAGRVGKASKPMKKNGMGKGKGKSRIIDLSSCSEGSDGPEEV